MGTGLIYAAIVAAWAVYLVPLWLRRNDEAQAARAGDPMPETSRVLTRRGAEQPATHVPAEPEEATDTGQDEPAAPAKAAESIKPTGSAKSAESTKPDEPAKPAESVESTKTVGGDDIDLSGLDENATPARADRRQAPSAAARRGRTMLLLVLATTLVAVLAVTKIVPGWSVSIPGTLVVLFALLSAMVGRQERRRAEHGAAPPQPNARAERRTRTASAYGHGRAAAPGDPDPGSVPAQEPFDGSATDAQSGRRTPPARRPGPRAGQEWDPVSVPLPTYVSKAKAPRTVRTIDLTESDTYSSGRTADTQAAAPTGGAEPQAPAGDGNQVADRQQAEQDRGRGDDLFDQEQVRPAVGH